MHQAQIRTESVLFVFPALSFVKSLYRFPSYRPPGRSFLYFGSRYPPPEFVGNSRERARRSPARGFQRLQAPLGDAPKPTAPPGVRHGEARKPTAPPGLLHGEVRKPTAPPGLLHGEVRKPTTPPGLLHGEARKPTAPPGLLHGEAQKPTAPPGLLRGEAGKPTTAVAFARAGLFRPRGRPERRASL